MGIELILAIVVALVIVLALIRRTDTARRRRAVIFSDRRYVNRENPSP
jgi:FtsZ-interacting cell division protein ZipA